MNRRKKQIRSESHRRKRWNRLMIKAGMAVGTVGIIVGLLAWGSHAKFISIQTIQVSGNNVSKSASVVSTAEDVLDGNYIGLFSKDNSIIFPRGRTRSAIKQRYPRIKSVDLSLQTLSTLRIHVAERSPVGIWCRADSKQVSANTPCYFVDKDGYVYAEAPHFSNDVFFRYYQTASTTQSIGTQLMPTDTFRRISAFKDAVEQRLDMNTIGFVNMNRTDGRLLVNQQLDNEAFEGGIVFNYRDNLRTLFENLKTVVQKDILLSQMQNSDRKLSTIDMRFGNKVYFRFEDTGDVAGTSTDQQSTEQN